MKSCRCSRTHVRRRLPRSSSSSFSPVAGVDGVEGGPLVALALVPEYTGSKIKFNFPVAFTLLPTNITKRVFICKKTMFLPVWQLVVRRVGQL